MHLDAECKEISFISFHVSILFCRSDWISFYKVVLQTIEELRRIQRETNLENVINISLNDEEPHKLLEIRGNQSKSDWNNVIGMDEAKKALWETFFMKYQLKNVLTDSQLDIFDCFSVLLYGPPGMLGRAI